jgi:hydrogenase maturation protein HypF
VRAEHVRRSVRVSGIVQGVGFRPFVHGLATELGLTGEVGNDAAGVRIEVEGDEHRVATFERRLVTEAPPLAVIETTEVRTVAVRGDTGFAIAPSTGGHAGHAGVPPDVATCGACLAEITDPGDRRYRYPFINCTDCGPRFTITRSVPYDRPRTTMAAFEMCGDCGREYHEPTDRRFHAQPVCCPRCGPQLRLVEGRATVATADAALVATARLLRRGGIVAVKGLGGYHLVVDARSETAVATLRARKHREDKPFAVMVADVDAARTLADVDDHAAALLADRARPIVLVPRRADTGVAAAVAPGHRSLGLLLPYTPLHHLLLAEAGGPLVVTSGNLSDEPIVHRDDDALELLGPIADAVLAHDRPIHVRTDDSVARVFAGRPLLLRRARGYAPAAVHLAAPAPRPVLALGAELKNTICLVGGTRAVVSPHIGDLEDYGTFTSFLEQIEHLQGLSGVSPALVAHDLHPEYLSTKHAHDLPLPLTGVQHHHAHIASCLVDNGRDERVIGVAFDGTGYGTDGTLWGGEFLVADLDGFDRVAHLATVPMPGGAAAIREPWRMAAAYVEEAFGGDVPGNLPVRHRNAERWDAVLAAAAAGLNAPLTSSVGRLFDAVAVLLGVRDRVTYEGQAAIELEQLATRSPDDGYVIAVGDGAPAVVDAPAMVRAVVDDLARGTSPAEVAGRFHAGLAGVVAGVCERVRDATGIRVVALSGGVFQNLLLVELVVARLEAAGFEVLLHRRVPPNDGGISLGQAAVAAARDRAGWRHDAAPARSTTG